MQVRIWVSRQGNTSARHSQYLLVAPVSRPGSATVHARALPLSEGPSLVAAARPGRENLARILPLPRPCKNIDFYRVSANDSSPYMQPRFLAPLSGIGVLLLAASMLAQTTPLSPKQEEVAELDACAKMVGSGFLTVPENRDQRFLGKVTEPTARCRGGMFAVNFAQPRGWTGRTTGERAIPLRCR